jgi:hypothetical protein
MIINSSGVRHHGSPLDAIVQHFLYFYFEIV